MIENTATYEFLIENENQSLAIGFQPGKRIANHAALAERADDDLKWAVGRIPAQRSRCYTSSHPTLRQRFSSSEKM